MSDSRAVQPFSFSDIEFADNAEPRCACLLILDNSGSMAGARLEQLNAGVRQFREELMADPLAQKRVEVGVISFGPVKVVTEFTTADQWNPVTLEAESDTPMGSAIEKALDMIERRKSDYRKGGVSMYRPWMILITDGSPTDSVHSASLLIREGEAAKKFAFFAIGVDGANMDALKNIAAPERGPMRLDGHKFREFFMWLSASMKSVSQSSTSAATLGLPSTTGWAQL